MARPSPDAGAARMIALDWGSTGLRAFLLGDDGAILDSRASADGSSAMNADAGAYSAALGRMAGDWLQAQPDLPVVACGMVGSQHGWREARYVACPAGAEALAQHSVIVHDGAGHTVTILPGLSQSGASGSADVMRGEETQIAGALALYPELAPRSVLVLPGTHSKWARIVAGRVHGFATHMTGELFAILRAHSVLGRLMPEAGAAADAQAFAAGVTAARERGHLGLAHQLFTVRSQGLLGELAPAAAPDYLSGLLLGHEIAAGLAARAAAGLNDAPLVLVGEPALCARYAQALDQFDAPAARVLPNTAPQGLWRLASAAGLLRSAAAAPSHQESAP